jgi:hypothetical protein
MRTEFAFTRRTLSQRTSSPRRVSLIIEGAKGESARKGSVGAKIGRYPCLGDH